MHPCPYVDGDVVQLRALECTFGNLVGVILGFAGIVLFIMLLIGGLKYMTAGGEPPKIEEAKKTLTIAIGGLILVMLAFLIIKLIEVFTGLPVTEFRVFQP